MTILYDRRTNLFTLTTNGRQIIKSFESVKRILRWRRITRSESYLALWLATVSGEPVYV